MQRTIILLDRLRALGIKIATAESCTGGMISAMITDVPGSSDVFDRGVVTYSNQSKIEMLNVSPKTLEIFGAVSEQVCCEMAISTLKKSGAGIAISITGIAGPAGATDSKPVGLVYIGISRYIDLSIPVSKIYNADNISVRVFKFHFSGTRSDVRKQAAEKAIDLCIDNLSIC